MTDGLYRYTTSARARTERLPDPPPGEVEQRNEHLHGDLTGVVFDPSPGCITLSFGPSPDGAVRVVRRNPWPQPSMTRRQRLARTVRVARMRVERWWWS